MSESGNPLNNLKHQNNYMFGHIEECEFEESHNVGLASHRNDFKKNCNNSRQKKQSLSSKKINRMINSAHIDEEEEKEVDDLSNEIDQRSNKKGQYWIAKNQKN